MAEKMAQKVKMIFNFDFLSLKTIFNMTEESVPLCNLLTTKVHKFIVFFLISHSFVQVDSFENENL